jgi:hypothetical protein
MVVVPAGRPSRRHCPAPTPVSARAAAKCNVHARVRVRREKARGGLGRVPNGRRPQALCLHACGQVIPLPTHIEPAAQCTQLTDTPGSCTVTDGCGARRVGGGGDLVQLSKISLGSRSTASQRSSQA